MGNQNFKGIEILGETDFSNWTPINKRLGEEMSSRSTRNDLHKLKKSRINTEGLFQRNTNCIAIQMQKKRSRALRSRFPPLALLHTPSTTLGYVCSSNSPMEKTMNFGQTQVNLSSSLRKINSKQLPVIFATGLWRLLGKYKCVDTTFPSNLGMSLHENAVKMHGSQVWQLHMVFSRKK